MRDFLRQLVSALAAKPQPLVVVTVRPWLYRLLIAAGAQPGKEADR